MQIGKKNAKVLPREKKFPKKAHGASIHSCHQEIENMMSFPIKKG